MTGIEMQNLCNSGTTWNFKNAIFFCNWVVSSIHKICLVTNEDFYPTFYDDAGNEYKEQHSAEKKFTFDTIEF